MSRVTDYFRNFFYRKSVSFSFKKDDTRVLGAIYQPVAKVYFLSDFDNKWRSIQMLVDTGADYSILPKYAVSLLEIDLKKSKRVVESVGIGGSQKVSFIEKTKVKIGSFKREIPVGIAHSNKLPPIMGRHLFFETFNVSFNKRNKLIFKN
ncbi:MAG: retroviral-like aspartic protease family protein [Patescibacteria group bacterium]